MKINVVFIYKLHFIQREVLKGRAFTERKPQALEGNKCGVGRK